MEGAETGTLRPDLLPVQPLAQVGKKLCPHVRWEEKLRTPNGGCGVGATRHLLDPMTVH